MALQPVRARAGQEGALTLLRPPPLEPLSFQGLPKKLATSTSPGPTDQDREEGCGVREWARTVFPSQP